jgi:diadenosine tetraphosphate (Ap4A) HIT family hydrolase
LLAKNDSKNPSEGKKYSRIDYLIFNDMAPYNWGFCLTVYNAPDASSAKKAPAANRAEPKKGCNGFPFSRMKRSE